MHSYNKIIFFFIVLTSGLCQNTIAMEIESQTTIPSTELTLNQSRNFKDGSFRVPVSINNNWVKWGTSSTEAQNYWKGYMVGNSPRKATGCDFYDHYTFGSHDEILNAIYMVNNPGRRVRTLDFHTTKPDGRHILWHYDVSKKVLTEDEELRRGDAPSDRDEESAAKSFIEAWHDEASKITQPNNFPKRK